MDETSIGRTLQPDDTWELSKQACADEECFAVREIVCAADAYAKRLIPNTMGYRSPSEAQEDARRLDRNIQALGQEHPSRISLYCRLLARVAATITGNPDHSVWTGHEDRTGLNVTDLAIRLDRPGNHCLADVVAAVPRVAAAQDDMAYARTCLRHVRQCQRQLDPPLR